MERRKRAGNQSRNPLTAQKHIEQTLSSSSATHNTGKHDSRSLQQAKSVGRESPALAARVSRLNPPFGVDKVIEEDETQTVDQDEKIDSLRSNSVVVEAVEDLEEMQFAWWSKFWSKQLRATDKVKPIKPVKNFWKGNFQNRSVPWRKEQLGAFPSYRDFPWPPPKDEDGVAERVTRHMERCTPFSIDRSRFRGASERTINQTMRDSKLLPDFLHPSRRMHNNQTYDPLVGQAFSDLRDRLLCLIADKLDEHGVRSYAQALASFDTDQSGRMNIQDFQRFLSLYGVAADEEQIDELFFGFESASRPGSVPYSSLVTAIESVGRARGFTR
mmetsp:Transcript_13583/g.47189  ORF Transcript_13583/g.47189 Transcript_13583/m.47189 type:complete len:329 (-) Transcript_13583:3863-4849(-)